MRGLIQRIIQSTVEAPPITDNGSIVDSVENELFWGPAPQLIAAVTAQLRSCRCRWQHPLRQASDAYSAAWCRSAL
jgi:hypothetical protein